MSQDANRLGIKMNVELTWPPTLEEVSQQPQNLLAVRMLTQLEGRKANLHSIVRELREEVPATVGAPPENLEYGAPPLPHSYELSLSEAWGWLKANRLIAEIPLDEGWYRVSRLGYEILDMAQPVSHVNAVRQLAIVLHPALEKKVRFQFLQGQYEAAVHIAFRTVEERIRSGAGLGPTDTGAEMVRRAFGPFGALRPDGTSQSEADARMGLFMGAVGLFANPCARGTTNFEDPTDAVELILLADLLMRILDRSLLQ